MPSQQVSADKLRPVKSANAGQRSEQPAQKSIERAAKTAEHAEKVKRQAELRKEKEQKISTPGVSHSVTPKF